MPTIVAAYDGSDLSRAAVRHAVALAAGGRVVVVHAYDSPPPTLNARWRELLEHDHVERAQSVLDAILLEGDDELDNDDFEARLAPGEPAEAVLNVAHEVDAAGIVVGSHGYGPVTALLGSVSHELLRKADIPITVISRAAAERAAS